MPREQSSPRAVQKGLGPRPKQTGFSLYDLIVTSAVAGVLGVGAVGFAGLINDARMTGAVNQLMADLNLARSESIKRHVMVALCKSGDGAACSSEADWHHGWIVFADENNNHKVDKDETVIRVQQRLEGGLKLRYGETGSYGYVRYKPDGEAWPGSDLQLLRRPRRAQGQGSDRLLVRPPARLRQNLGGQAAELFLATCLDPASLPP